MIRFNVFLNKYTVFISLIVAFVAFFLKGYSVNTIFYKFEFFNKLYSPNQIKNDVYTLESLALYNGIDNERMYLAILGKIFDVSKGRKYYEKGAGYHFFIGKDGSRSFVTGNFTDESENKDHVIDLSCDELLSITNWVDTYRKRYLYRGLLIGRYYDKNGKATPYKKQLTDKLKQCKQEKLAENDFKQKYPPCNIEWSQDDGTRVWCTKNSGGIKRSWIGVPRKLFIPGETNDRCVCIDLMQDNSAALLRSYDNCPSDSESCNVLIN